MARQWQTVLVSMLLHVAALFLIVAVPLLAMDGFPGIPSMTTYVPVEVKAPAMPPAPTVASIATPRATNVSGAPIEAPTTITAEAPTRPPSLAEVTGVGANTGVPGGVGIVPGDATNVALPNVEHQEPVRPGGNVQAPARTLFVAPIYPAAALAARVSGHVIVEAIIGTDGRVRNAKVLRSVLLLDDAALAAVRQWRYTPTTLNGIPVPVMMTVTVRFDLGG